jgi:hypothetical protein
MIIDVKVNLSLIDVIIMVVDIIKEKTHELYRKST